MYFQETVDNSAIIMEQEDKLQELEECFYIDKEDTSRTRLMVNSYLVDLFRNALGCPEQLDRIQGIMSKLSEHPDFTLRLVLIKTLSRLALLCYGGDRLNYVNTQLWPLLVSCLPDKNEEVRKASEICLLILIKGKLLERETLEEQVCPFIVEISKLDGYASTVALMGKMAPLIGKEATEKYFLDRFVHLCTNENPVIREMCAQSLGGMCTVLGTEITESVLLPLFVQLSRDESWEVRFSCAEVSLAVSCSCTLATRKSVLAPVFTDLLMDVKPWVRLTAFRFLGAFICTFADPSVTKLDYDENGELIFVGQDGYEFRMPSVQFECSRDMELMENVDSLPWEPKDQSLDNTNFYSFINFTNPKRARWRALRMPDVQFNYSREMELMENIDSYPCEPEVADQSLNKNSSDNFDLPGLNPNPRLVKIYNEQPVGKTSWTSQGKNAENNSTDNNSGETEDADESFNTFRFWRTPLPQLDTLDLEPEQDEIRTNLNILDKELSTLSEKLAECSVGDLEDIKTESVISSSSCPDSGWNSTEVTSHIEPILPQGPKMEGGLQCADTDSESSNETPETNLPNQEIVPQLLLDYFVSMTESELMDKEIAQGCAYSLPAVALTLGPSNWPYLKKAYKRLSGNLKWRVRRTVVSSIHKLASILGEEIASEDLAPIFKRFISGLAEVKVEALEHLADFLKLVKPETRNSFLPLLDELLDTKSDWNWRYRKEFVEQLRLLINLFSPTDWLEYFEPYTTFLLCDKVAAVRHEAVLLFLDLLTNLSGEPEFQVKLLFILLEKFAGHSLWRRRQIFVLVCSEIAKQKALDNEDFCTILLDQLLVLSKDPVPNVCLGVARCLSVDVISTGYITPSSPHYSVIIETLERLKTHTDSDIRYFASLHEELKDNDTNPPSLQDLELGT